MCVCVRCVACVCVRCVALCVCVCVCVCVNFHVKFIVERNQIVNSCSV